MSWEVQLQFELKWTGKPAKSEVEKLKIEVNLEECIIFGSKKNRMYIGVCSTHIHYMYVCTNVCMLICVYRSSMKKNGRYRHAVKRKEITMQQ